MAATLAPEAHVRKRQYQPPINSYFANRDAPSSSAPERARSPMSPPLPDDTQASLLSVGMRVRKSVPEGYKTHKTMNTNEFPFPSTAPVRKTAKTLRHAPAKELMPFCGLHKTGGWGAQEVPSSSAPAGLGGMGPYEDEDDMPGLSMSQGTLSSTQGSFERNEFAHVSTGRKRTHEDEVEDDLDAYFDDIGAEPVALPVQRPIAKLKEHKRLGGQPVPVRCADGLDFEDAVFLAPEDGMDVDAS